MRKPTLVLLALLLAAPAAAIDTFEPYPTGLHAFEFYGSRYGLGAGGDAERGYAAFGGPAVGLGAMSHAYLFTGLHSDDEQRGGVDFLTLGYFQTAWDRGLDLDYWLELTSFGEGLGLVSRAVGLELNLEAPRGGFFWRGVFDWENDGLDESDAVVVGRRDTFTYGLLWNSSPLVQVFADLVQERTTGFETAQDDSRLASWALGYNRRVSEEVEMVFEARRQLPAAGEDTWDLTVGWVVVWE